MTEIAPALYEVRGLKKEFSGPSENILVFSGISFTIKRGETISIMGASGTGKSSLLHILGTLANPSEGTVLFSGEDLGKASATKKAQLRSTDIGFIFQFHHLLSEFTTLENVAMPALIAGCTKEEALSRAQKALKRVGLERREQFDVTLLSGGERQRVAIARAIIQQPKVLLADEPTGNLDARNGAQVAELLIDLNTVHNMAMVVVTHNIELASCMGRQFELKSGDLYEQTS